MRYTQNFFNDSNSQWNIMDTGEFDVLAIKQEDAVKLEITDFGTITFHGVKQESDIGDVFIKKEEPTLIKEKIDESVGEQIATIHVKIESETEDTCRNLKTIEELSSKGCDLSGSLITKSGREDSEPSIEDGTLEEKSDSNFKCANCSLVYETKKSLQIHLSSTYESGIKCCKCDETFANKCLLTLHQVAEGHRNRYMCSHCNASYTRKVKLREHISRCHNKGEQPIKRKPTPRRKPTGPGFVCPECKKPFSSRQGYRRHLDIHENKYRFGCTTCNKKFRQKKDLTLHERIHSGVKPYSCDICHKSFISKDKLNRHCLSHSTGGTLMCDICGYRTNYRDVLEDHRRVHTDGSQYVCPACGKSVCRKTFHVHRDLQNAGKKCPRS